MSGIRWGNKNRPRKADQGHTPVQYGFGKPNYHGRVREYVRCECGTRLSGWDGLASWRKHQKREIAKAAGQ